MGISRGAAGSGRDHGDDGGEIRHSGKRSHDWRILEGACEGRAEDEEESRDFEILESLLGERVHGQGVLCEGYHI